ncbi:MAG TPA: methylated-DNA--[protein]-cysteine S-methyltransferase [Opitutaceae bacterium]|nr:methylated-DNA--[protein]-cysteine S-methyltransferase [Opitutaceae bacterium]
MSLYWSTFPTPFGEFSIAVDETGAVAATAFGDAARLRSYLDEPSMAADETRTAPAREQVLAYCAGRRREFDLPLAPAGTPFQQRVWTALRRIPFGKTCSYGEVARQLKSSPRAVGRANGTNPICLIVPCHRVIGADGSLTGFGYGNELKRRLLEHEGALTPVLALV